MDFRLLSFNILREKRLTDAKSHQKLILSQRHKFFTDNNVGLDLDVIKMCAL